MALKNVTRCPQGSSLAQGTLRNKSKDSTKRSATIISHAVNTLPPKPFTVISSINPQPSGAQFVPHRPPQHTATLKSTNLAPQPVNNFKAIFRNPIDTLDGVSRDSTQASPVPNLLDAKYQPHMESVLARKPVAIVAIPAAGGQMKGTTKQPAVSFAAAAGRAAMAAGADRIVAFSAPRLNSARNGLQIATNLDKKPQGPVEQLWHTVEYTDHGAGEVLNESLLDTWTKVREKFQQAGPEVFEAALAEKKHAKWGQPEFIARPYDAPGERNPRPSTDTEPRGRFARVTSNYSRNSSRSSIKTNDSQSSIRSAVSWIKHSPKKFWNYFQDLDARDERARGERRVQNLKAAISKPIPDQQSIDNAQVHLDGASLQGRFETAQQANMVLNGGKRATTFGDLMKGTRNKELPVLPAFTAVLGVDQAELAAQGLEARARAYGMCNCEDQENIAGDLDGEEHSPTSVYSPRATQRGTTSLYSDPGNPYLKK